MRFAAPAKGLETILEPLIRWNGSTKLNLPGRARAWTARTALRHPVNQSPEDGRQNVIKFLRNCVSRDSCGRFHSPGDGTVTSKIIETA